MSCNNVSRSVIMNSSAVKILFILLCWTGVAIAQEMTGTVVNYSAGQTTPVEGIEVYLDGVKKDTTNASGTFGFPTAIIYDPARVPKAFTLKLFPNPFNPSTILEYTVPYQADVSIVGYNALGQKVYSEQQKNQPAGTYKLTFDASKYDLASQMLFFQVLIDPKDASIAPSMKVVKGVYTK